MPRRCRLRRRRDALNLGGDEAGDSGESLDEGDVAVDLGDLFCEVLLGVRRNHATEDDDIDVRGVVLRQHLVELVGRVCVEALASQDVRRRRGSRPGFCR
jgi:hypothetical protein